MGDGRGRSRGLERLAAQHRAPGLRPRRRTTARSRRCSRPAPCGFKIHEDYGADPELIDRDPAVRRRARRRGLRSTPTGCTSRAELEDTVAAIDGRTVHAYHVEGSGGGHVPDVIGLVREPNVICSSTTPTVPFGVNAAAEQVADDRPQPRRRRSASRRTSALVRERVHAATMAAEGPLHELGAIAIVNSDSQGMGRIMETVRRTFQLAHVMKRWRDRAAGIRADPAPTGRRQRARPALPGQGHDRAGDHARHRRPRRLARAGPARGHRAVGAGLLRRQAGARAQGRACRPGRRSARAMRRSRAPSRRATAPDWGGRPRAAAVAVGDVRLARRRPARRALRRLGTGGRSSRSRGTRGLTRDVAASATARSRRSRSMRPTVGSRSTGRPARRSSPVAEVPLSRALPPALNVGPRRPLAAALGVRQLALDLALGVARRRCRGGGRGAACPRQPELDLGLAAA